MVHSTWYMVCMLWYAMVGSGQTNTRSLLSETPVLVVGQFVTCVEMTGGDWEVGRWGVGRQPGK